MTAAIIVGLLTTGGVYLVLQRGIVRMALGFVLLGHAATTLLVASGGVARRGVPFIGASGETADPLPQAFALTAIVISFGITAFLLTLAFRGRDTLGDDDVERLRPGTVDPAGAGSDAQVLAAADDHGPAGSDDHGSAEPGGTP
jgi:multicomponent Na+:H+ antiporter subunit C